MVHSIGSWQGRVPQPGDAALELLAPEWAAGIVGALADGPLRPAELKERLPDTPHATLMERLKGLARGRVVMREHPGDGRRGARYALNERGQRLGEIVTAAALIERGHAGRWDGRPEGESMVRVIADPCNRAIRRVLAGGPLTLAEIERALPGLAHSTVGRRVRELVQAGVIEALRYDETRYELVAEQRRLALLALLAARWEGRWEGRWADVDARAPSDVSGLVHMIAPLAQVPSGMEGACRFHIEDEPSEPDIDISVGRGKIAALPLAPTVTLDAHGSGSAHQWGRSLLRCEPSDIAIEGDRVLLGAVVVALGKALRV